MSDIIKTLTQQLSTSKQALSISKEKNEQLQKDQALLEEQISKIQTQYNAKLAELQEAHEQLQDAEEDDVEQAQQYNALLEEANAYKDLLDTLQQQLSALKQQLSTFQQKNDKLAQDQTLLEQRISNIQMQYDANLEELRKAQNQLQDAQADDEEQVKKYNKLLEEVNTYQDLLSRYAYSRVAISDGKTLQYALQELGFPIPQVKTFAQEDSKMYPLPQEQVYIAIDTATNQMMMRYDDRTNATTTGNSTQIKYAYIENLPFDQFDTINVDNLSPAASDILAKIKIAYDDAPEVIKYSHNSGLKLRASSCVIKFYIYKHANNQLYYACTYEIDKMPDISIATLPFLGDVFDTQSPFYLMMKSGDSINTYSRFMNYSNNNTQLLSLFSIGLESAKNSPNDDYKKLALTIQDIVDTTKQYRGI